MNGIMDCEWIVIKDCECLPPGSSLSVSFHTTIIVFGPQKKIVSFNHINHTNVVSINFAISGPTIQAENPLFY